ncbi:MAG TPA: hypothetical protein VFH45_08070, partial [Acidimicrobiales bacterium]|nr:hypothetical protein [Acidimicrobiales bacterium]
MTGPSQDQVTQAAQAAEGRHVRDVVRLAVALVVVTLAFLAAATHQMDPVEAAIYRDVIRLPTWLLPPSRGISWLGSPAAIAGVAGVALFWKRPKLGIELVLGGTVAWVASHVSAALVAPRSLSVAGAAGVD